MIDLTTLTLEEARLALQRGDYTSYELTQAYLSRMQALEPQIKAFITPTPDLALAGASRADKQLDAWRKTPETPLPPLTGVPLAVKDVLCVAGVRCTAGSRLLENYVPPYHATTIERMLAAGALILGKTNTDEFAMGSSTENSGFGGSHNPWDLKRVPGGSSGGSAAAVAARMAPAALGSDTGGSVRQPAAFCGLTGIKPTYGRVSRYGLIAYASSLDVVGALGYNVVDTARLFLLLSGPDPKDATTARRTLPELQPENLLKINVNRPLTGLRLGVPEEYFISGIQPEVEKTIRSALDLFTDLGAEVLPVNLPHTRYAVPVYYLIAPAEASANLARYDGIRYGARLPAERLLDMYRQTRGAKLGPEVKRRIMLGTYALSAGYYDAYYGQAQKVRTLIQRDFETVFGQVDLIAAPVAPTTAFKIGEHGDDPLSMYLEDVFTLPANLAGIPGLSFPVGFDSHGLPVGMQLMGPNFTEGLLFATAGAYQAVTDWHTRFPTLIQQENK